MLRQDPDIIMVGEIRDTETAENAVQAALTGHLVLSTLHTNDASSSITRLLDLGVPHFLITSTLIGILAQRLVRENCKHCLEEYAPTVEESAALRIPMEKLAPYKFKRGKGCLHCRETGYTRPHRHLRGPAHDREDPPPGDARRRAPSRSSRRRARRACARSRSPRSRRSSAGVTTVTELVRVTGK